MRALSVALFVLAAVSAAAQSKPPSHMKSAVATIPASKTAGARTHDGRPDLQGTWDFAQLTPLERPSDFANRDAITEEEAEEFAERRIETTNKDRRDGGASVDLER